MKKLCTLTALPLLFAVPLAAQEAEPEYVTPGSVVANAAPEEWVTIAPENLLVMELAPDSSGRARTVVIQLIPAPFSQPWVENIRTLTEAHWWDGTSVNRVQDNYVTQWGDVTEEKPLPEGVVAPTADYEADVEAVADATHDFGPPLPAYDELPESVRQVFEDPNSTHEDHIRAIEMLIAELGLDGSLGFNASEQLAMLSINTTQTRLTEQGWHNRDGYAPWVEFWQGWPIANEEVIVGWEDEEGNAVSDPGPRRPPHQFDPPYSNVESSTFWPIHCYGYVGVGRGYAPDTGTGAELYTIIGQPQRHMDRNLAVVGRIIEGMEHLSSLPRGSGDLGFYTDEEAHLRVPILSVRLGSELENSPAFEYLSTESESFAQYVQIRANRNDPFYTVPAGGVDVCSVQVPVRRVAE
ncbi:peptidylprolyl isomerase [Aurantiacibacter sp. D1-12]|uniref:peptidylprolyl isomerase n=1 Tax=Aurantiacibacter sp. D1-12 TaxID=2993658 RepID=UPI00237D2E32|nr:peptidylprolyl isomerase [Aurantiacibacter sp. D1-12]MDE1467739.1 peptidylprolyl isomerase [Aurantiacibacter sp. D1-12]